MSEDTAYVPFRALETLWIQLTGTLCNLACTHCFISCSPTNDSLGFMTREQVREVLTEGATMGASEFYVTGGEPFLHPELIGVVDDILAHGPVTVLTNGILITASAATDLARIRQERAEALELRVSLDGPDAASNDAIRGAGNFDRAMRGVEHVVGAGFRPILTMMRSWDEADDAAIVGRFSAALAEIGYRDPRIKLLPQLRIGAEAVRSRPYHSHERVTAGCIANYDLDQLMCHTTRVASAEGIHVCPILVDENGGNLGPTLAGATDDYALRHAACFTCVVNGAICSNDNAVFEGPVVTPQD